MDKKIPYGPQSSFSVFENTMVELTWPEIQAGADRNAVVLLPIGIVESHGPHLDLSADFYLSTLSCRFLQQELHEIGVEALIAPPIYWGVSPIVAKYAGTFSVRPKTMQALLTDIMASLRSWGFRRVFVCNAHGDHKHIAMIQKAMKKANRAPGFRVYPLWDLDIAVDSDVKLPPEWEGGFQPDVHAGAIETAQMAAFFPEKVRHDIANTLKPQASFHPFAYCGDPASYDREYNFAEYAMADAMLDALKIQAVLKGESALGGIDRK